MTQFLLVVAAAGVDIEVEEYSLLEPVVIQVKKRS